MNCKPGDLAVIVSAPSNPENLGLVVHIDKLWAPGPNGGKLDGWKFRGDVPAWVCTTTGRPMATCFAGKTAQFYKRPLADSVLRPIRPGDISDEEVRDLYLPQLPEIAEQVCSN